MKFNPEKNSTLHRGSIWGFWWNAIDRWILVCSVMLIALGTWLILAASPSIAAQHGWTTFVLLKRHLVFVLLGVAVLFFGSFIRKEYLKLQNPQPTLIKPA